MVMGSGPCDLVDSVTSTGEPWAVHLVYLNPDVRIPGGHAAL